VITKTDLADEARTAALEGKLRELNPRAPIRRALNGEIELAFLVDVGLTNTKGRLEEVERWMGAEAYGDDEHGDGHGHGHRHDERVTSFSLRYDQPFSWAGFSQCLEVLTTLRGPDLLRVKGLVNVAGHPGPLIVQGVQHLFHPPVELQSWPSEDRSTRIVFITRGIDRAMVANLFAAVGAIVPA
jgi:G3E family GTPase